MIYRVHCDLLFDMADNKYFHIVTRGQDNVILPIGVNDMTKRIFANHVNGANTQVHNRYNVYNNNYNLFISFKRKTFTHKFKVKYIVNDCPRKPKLVDDR